jgi:hypothetical protein
MGRLMERYRTNGDINALAMEQRSTVIPTERSEWRNLLFNALTPAKVLAMAGANAHPRHFDQASEASAWRNLLNDRRCLDFAPCGRSARHDGAATWDGKAVGGGEAAANRPRPLAKCPSFRPSEASGGNSSLTQRPSQTPLRRQVRMRTVISTERLGN